MELASIAIRPLTILVGPNNSGKSYVAALLRSILTAQRIAAGVRSGPSCAGAASHAFCRLVEKKHGQNRRRMAITGAESGRVFRTLVASELCPALERQIARDFGSEPRDLVRAGKAGARIEVSERDPGTGKTRRLSVSLAGRLSASMAGRGAGYVVETTPGRARYRVDAALRGRRDAVAEGNWRSATRAGHGGGGPGMHTDARGLSAAVAMDITERISSHLEFQTAPRGVHHIPAARSGLLQGPGAMDPCAPARAPHGDGGTAGCQRVPGAAGGFLSQMASLGGARGDFSALADSMDGELFGGSIRLGASGDGRREIVYCGADGAEVPLRRCSSSISEIAPLSLYLRHVVGRGALLVLEEPDEHLHPAAQMILAKYLVRLVRGGAGILLTTHSAFLLEKLAKYMMASGLGPGQRSAADLGYGRNDYLAPDEVSAHLFEGDAGGGYRTRPIERDEEYGVSQEEFVRVSEALHRETIILNSKMRARGGG